jgi:hypothetical protein
MNELQRKLHRFKHATYLSGTLRILYTPLNSKQSQWLIEYPWYEIVGNGDPEYFIFIVFYANVSH